MDLDNAELACGLVSRTYVQQGVQALARRRRLIKTLLSQRRLPEAGWDDATIELLLQVGADCWGCGLPARLDERRRRTAGGFAIGPHPPPTCAPTVFLGAAGRCSDGQQQLRGQCGGGGA